MRYNSTSPMSKVGRASSQLFHADFLRPRHKRYLTGADADLKRTFEKEPNGAAQTMTANFRMSV